MPRDPRVDAYINRQADFARPVLTHLRELVHSAWPGTEEAIKWGMPAYLANGKQFAQMAAFKAHATFGFWNSSTVLGSGERDDSAMGQFGRLTSIADLPDDATLAELIQKAAKLRSQGATPARAPRAPKPDLATPDDLVAALAADPAAAAHFEAFSPSAKREYAEWITESKRAETRAKRVAQAVEWIAQGKKRNWKYERC